MNPTFRLWLLVLGLWCAPALARAQAAWEDAPAEGPTPVETEDATGDAEADATLNQDSAASYSDRDPSALTDFNKDLEPYGYWRDDPTYGTVWVPHPKSVGKDFKPYVTNGHWAQADDGEWIWVSDYPFGWVVFHYGRWVWIRSVGWAWIPGRQYAHAWVVWRVPDPGVYYVGWAPMPPDYIWMNGYAVGVGFGLYTAWVFCPSHYMYSYHLHSHIVHDHHHVHYLGSHTHKYHAPGRAAYVGPSPSRARIPARALPSKRVAANPKAVAASKPSGASARRLQPGTRPTATRPPRSKSQGIAPSPRLDRTKSLGTSNSPGPRSAPPSFGTRPTPSYRSAPAPNTRSAPPQPSAPRTYRAPSRAPSSSSSRSTPSFRSSSRPSSPTIRQAPSRGVQPYRPSTPSRSRGTPSRGRSRGR
ncbi:MAG: DUF6600 domain-containing protein [Polyangiaceae bacterium]